MLQVASNPNLLQNSLHPDTAQKLLVHFFQGVYISYTMLGCDLIYKTKGLQMIQIIDIDSHKGLIAVIVRFFSILVMPHSLPNPNKIVRSLCATVTHYARPVRLLSSLICCCLLLQNLPLYLSRLLTHMPFC